MQTKMKLLLIIKSLQHENNKKVVQYKLEKIRTCRIGRGYWYDTKHYIIRA